MNKIKSQILEICEEVTFKRGLTDKLYGCAEMFGEDCIVLYEGINFIRYTSPTHCQEMCDFYFPGEARKLTELGYDHCIIGHLKMPDDSFRLVYDKDAIIEHLKSEYMQDKSGLFSGEEDCETSAVEFYEYNILGTGMKGVPAFATVMKY